MSPVSILPLAELTAADSIVLVVCLVLAVRGAIKGFVWQAVRTIGLIAALWGATVFADRFGDWLDTHIPMMPDVASDVIAWILIAAGVFLLVSYFAHMARGAIRTADLTAPDRVLGFGLGAVMGLVFCTIGLIVWGGFQPDDDELKSAVEGSQSVHLMIRIVDMVPVVPASTRDRWRGVLEELEGDGPRQADAAR